MKKIILTASLLILTLLLAACDSAWSAIQPAATTKSGDPNVGGGRAVVVGQMPTPAGTAIPVKQAVQPGGVVSTGNLTFTLMEVVTVGDKTQVTYQLQGLPKNYAEVKEVSDPWIVLLNGEILNAYEGVGGGSPVNAAGQVQFPALPSGTQQFTLVVPNNWTGKIQTWYIPVRLK